MKHKLQQRLGELPIRWRWTLHNLVGHPLSEVLYQLGAASVGNWVHDATLPEPLGEDTRG
jgi:hypothetical protein